MRTEDDASQRPEGVSRNRQVQRRLSILIMSMIILYDDGFETRDIQLIND